MLITKVQHYDGADSFFPHKKKLDIVDEAKHLVFSNILEGNLLEMNKSREIEGL
jgi:hypothetical protein